MCIKRKAIPWSTENTKKIGSNEKKTKERGRIQPRLLPKIFPPKQVLGVVIQYLDLCSRIAMLQCSKILRGLYLEPGFWNLELDGRCTIRLLQTPPPLRIWESIQNSLQHVTFIFDFNSKEEEHFNLLKKVDRLTIGMACINLLKISKLIQELVPRLRYLCLLSNCSDWSWGENLDQLRTLEVDNAILCEMEKPLRQVCPNLQELILRFESFIEVIPPPSSLCYLRVLRLVAPLEILRSMWNALDSDKGCRSHIEILSLLTSHRAFYILEDKTPYDLSKWTNLHSISLPTSIIRGGSKVHHLEILTVEPIGSFFMDKLKEIDQEFPLLKELYISFIYCLKPPCRVISDIALYPFLIYTNLDESEAKVWGLAKFFHVRRCIENRGSPWGDQVFTQLRSKVNSKAIISIQ